MYKRQKTGFGTDDQFIAVGRKLFPKDLPEIFLRTARLQMCIRDSKQAYQLIFEYLEAFYNTKRIHSPVSYTHLDVYKRQGTDLARQSVNALRVNSQHSKPHIDKNQDQHIHDNTHCPCAVDLSLIHIYLLIQHGLPVQSQFHILYS